MVDVWRKQLDFKEQLVSAKSPPIPVLSTQFNPSPPPPIILPFNSSNNEFPWLADQLSKSTKLFSQDISNIVQVFVHNAMDSVEILAAIKEKDFTDEFLDSIGIKSPGVKQKLLMIHKSLRINTNNQSTFSHHSSTEEVASAKELREVKVQLDALKTQLGSVSTDCDSDVVVGNQKMMFKGKQVMDRQSAGKSSIRTNDDRWRAGVDDNLQVLNTMMGNLHVGQESTFNPQMTTKQHEKDKKDLLMNKTN